MFLMDTCSKAFLEKGRELRNDSELGGKSKKSCKVLFDDLFKNIFKKKVQKRYEEFEALIINLIITQNSPVLWNRNKNWFKNKDWSYTAMDTFMNELKAAGYVDTSKYYFNHNDSSKSRISRAWALPKLTDYFRNSYIKIGVKLPLVELRDRAGKTINKYPPRGVATKFKKQLRIINRVNQNGSIWLLDKRLDTTIRAIFTKNFSCHGRLYTNGPNRFQRFSEDERKLITIDGDPVVELDYSALHPRLLYAHEGKQFDIDGCPYSIVDNRPEVRLFLKIMLLAMINSRDKLTATRACNYWLYNHPDEKNKLESLEVDTKELMERFIQAHKPVEKYLCSGNKTGMKLMNKDGRIALAVCSYFASQKKVVLPIHDSFIVKAEYRDELMKTMQRIYGRHNKGFRCPIK